MLEEVKSSAQEFSSPSSVPQTRERAAHSTSSVRTPPLCDCHARFHRDFLDNLAVVTPIPGTTGDILFLSLDMGDLSVIVPDAAGLRQTQDVVKNIGIERARQV
jgi:hypothetical protein